MKVELLWLKAMRDVKPMHLHPLPNNTPIIQLYKPGTALQKNIWLLKNKTISNAFSHL